MFYAIGNIGSSKKTDKSRLTDPSDPYECILEIMDVELPLSDFPQDTMMNAMEYTENETTKEKVYTWAKDENLGILYELVDGEYILTKDASVDLSKTYYVDILLHDDFSEDYTYGWRYIYEDGTDEENEKAWNVCHNAWIQAYRFITNSTDEEFKSRFEEYFVKDSALYYYLFTTRYCMVDSRAKNSFYHLGKTDVYRKLTNPVAELLPIYCELVDGAYVATTDTEIDSSKTYYTRYAFDLNMNYDDDTSMSLNNYGALSYRYGLEDTDVDEQGKEVFRESDSTIFCRIRDLFADELKTMFNTLESQNAWHAESFLNEIEKWQNQFPEELWRLDIQRKYLRSYNSSFINGAGDPQYLKNMANGKMKYAVKEWERSQEKYMASKYQSSLASSDNAVLRCTVPNGDLVVPVDYKAKLTPYNYMYLNVKYGTGSPIQVKAEPGKEYIIPFAGTSTDIVDIYSASCLQSVGDLSTFYATTVDTAKATRLKELSIGNDTVGYDNPYLTTMTLGANYLLEVLNVENVSGLTQSLNLTVLNNLRELYARGTNVGGVTFAPGGAIQIAELPAITAMSAKNLYYLTTLDIESYDKLTTLTVENCPTIDVLNILNLAENINRVRITGIDWTLDDTTLLDRLYQMTGIDKNGYNITQSVLAGKVHVPVVREKLLADYNEAWPDLEITYDSMIAQYTVTFVNDDKTVLDVQYVDKGAKPVDPTKREENPISTPIKESTVQYDYTFAGWDTELTAIFSNTTITATYTESVRQYTVKYVSKGTTVQTTTAEYGTFVYYEGDIPSYVAEESAYKYYLFTGWDRSGFVDGDKIINAVYDSCEYTSGYFNGKELSTMKPVEIYALTKLGLESEVVESMDSFSFDMGSDFDYDDIESTVLISSTTNFTGSNYIDTGISVIETDRNFVLAVDYEFGSDNSTNATLMQCFQTDGSNGFKLLYNSNPRIQWGTSSTQSASGTNREMLVLRHIAGETGLHVYTSNLTGSEIGYVELERTRTMTADSTLVFGCVKADDGAYENYAKGTVYWAKLWYTDLGDSACRELASYTHENINVEMCGFKRKYLSDGSSKRSSMSFLASHVLRTQRAMNNIGTNEGGWGQTDLNTWLNTRFYNGLPLHMKQLIKQVKVNSSAGNQSTEIVSSDCYVYIPAVIEVDSTKTTEPYVNEDTSIDFIINNADRIRKDHTGTAVAYWLRTPNAGYSTYFYYINANGAVNSVAYPSTEYGVVIEFSI